MATPLIVTPRDAALWLDFGGQYNAIQGQPNILTDGDMEAADASAWTNYNGTGSKSTASPHGGLRALRISYDGSHAAGWVRQAAGFAGGNVVQVSGWARGDGTAIPVVNEGSDQFVGTSSTSWQPFNVTFTCTSNQLYLGSKTLGVGNWVEFDDVQVILQNRVYDNLAERGDAVRTVKCADGVTSANFPGVVSGKRGATFNGSSQYIDTGITDLFERTDSFTLFVCAKKTAGTFGDLISSADEGNNIRGIALGYVNSIKYATYLCSTYNTSCIITEPLPSCGADTLKTLCMTYAGTSLNSGLSFYENGISIVTTAAFNNLSSTIKSGKSLKIGVRHNGAGFTRYFNGTIYHVSIFPSVLSPLQVKNHDISTRRRLNLP